MKKLRVSQVFILSLLATQVLAGNLTVNGNLTVTTNLTAQSITLGGVTQTNWPSGSNGGVIDLSSGVVDFSQTGFLYRFTGMGSSCKWKSVPL